MSAGAFFDARQWRQVAAISAGAGGIFLALRMLPTGTSLSHMDFRVDARGANPIEFCDPLNPQFIPVVAARSPVVMTIALAAPDSSSGELRAVMRLGTSSGKAILPEDLLVTHTRRLHLLIVDPTLGDYQHLHPEPTKTPGEWTFAFSPHRGGMYRFFADFTPAATGRGLYASADLDIARAANPKGEASLSRNTRATVDGHRFALTTSPLAPRAGRGFDLAFTVRRDDGGRVLFEPVMGAYAHLVAFDETRSGFAHLHPVESDLAREPDATNPTLNFKLTIPRAGRYVIWAQVNLGGREIFVPFEIEVTE